MKINQTFTTTKEVEIEIPSYWKFGPTLAAVVSEGVFIQVCIQSSGNTEVAKYNFLSSVEWQPCTQDEFMAAYCAAINAISAASGIEHSPLIMQPDFLTESNPES